MCMIKIMSENLFHDNVVIDGMIYFSTIEWITLCNCMLKLSFQELVEILII